MYTCTRFRQENPAEERTRSDDDSWLAANKEPGGAEERNAEATAAAAWQEVGIGIPLFNRGSLGEY